nr:VOC family protein [Rhodococcus sp. (in: high G+C Gram-positive bacteria)]
MTGFGRVFAVTIDCAEPRTLGDLRQGNLDFVVLASDVGVRLDFQRVENPQPMPWPSADATRRLHLDVRVDDLDDAEAQLLELGAERADYQPGADRFRVFVDPEGHPFCIVTDVGSEFLTADE